MSDPYAANVVLLAHFDGANNATSAIDSAWRHTLGFNGAAKLSTTRPKFGATALDALAASTDYVDILGNLADFDFGNGDFTVEAWCQFDSLTATRGVIRCGTGANLASAIGWHITVSSTSVAVSVSDGSITYPAHVASSPGTGVTCSIALERYSGTIYAYLNGTVGTFTSSIGTATVNPMASSGSNPVIGKSPPSQFMSGMVDEIRITKGVGRYGGASYTPSASAFDDPPHQGSGFLSFNAGTPSAGHLGTGLFSFHAGTPTVHTTVTGVATGLSAPHFGTPTWRGITRHNVAALAPTFHAGTPSTPTERYAQASGIAHTHVGDPVAIIFVPLPINRVVVPTGLHAFHAGTPTVSATVTSAATGSRTFHAGTPTAAAIVICATSGIDIPHAGTPVAVRQQRASGLHAFHVGTPISARITTATGAPSHTHIGTPTYTRGANTHFARTVGSRFRAGQPRGFICRVTYPAGFSSFHAGSPAATEHHRVTAIAPTFRAGTPLVLRNPEC